MAIFSGSRYQGVAYTGVKALDGSVRKFLHDRRIYSLRDVGNSSFEYVVQGEEQLDGLADSFYGDQNLGWLIADVNNILFPLDIRPGDRLVIPNKSLVTELGLL